jgi:hypothetical protein
MIITCAGTKPIWPSDIHLKSSGSELIDEPPENERATPLRPTIVPSVTIKGGMRRLAISHPCAPPMSEPSAKPAPMARYDQGPASGGTGPAPYFIRLAVTSPVKATTELTDRSMPPISMTMVWPSATSAIGAA